MLTARLDSRITKRNIWKVVAAELLKTPKALYTHRYKVLVLAVTGSRLGVTQTVQAPGHLRL